ncbi:MAG TPA: iron-containing alcohol dehydrogenase [Solirubrobacterales bacterium]|nr:iron-containing alcohol dehydrogenase [Solirubrobacterales bacterium]
MNFGLRIAGHKARLAGYTAGLAVLPIKQPKVLMGPGSVDRLCAVIGSYGFSRILLVTDEDLVGLGLPDGLRKGLEQQGLEVTVHDQISPNPTEAQIRAGIEAGKRIDCEAVVAFGGGSPMDAAKVIAAGQTNKKDVADMEGPFRIWRAPVPIFAVPTTAGTGSEATFAAVVTNPDERRKYAIADFKLVPDAAALDPELMVGLPPAITAATGMDALTHAIESFICTRANDESQRSGRITAKLVFDNLPTAYEKGDDIEARESMALAAYEGGLSFAKVGLGYVHGIAHQLGGMYHIPHGLANAVVLPRVLDYSKDSCADRLAELALLVGVGDPSHSEAALADAFIDAVRDLSRRLGIPEHFEQIQEADVPLIAERAIDEAFELYAVPKYMRQDDAERVVRQLIPA